MCRHEFIPLLALISAFGAVPARLSQAQWRVDGVPVCTAVGDQAPSGTISDSAGGVIVTWQSGGDIYAQRVSAAGVPQWTADGVALCTDASSQALPTIASDGAGGAIITWQDQRDGNQTDIYVRRVNAAGVPQWTPDGVALCTNLCSQERPTIVSDGAGGAIVTWQDLRSGINSCTSYYDIYAQRVNGAGAPQWTPDGVALCTAAESQSLPTIVSDGAGGAIVAWQDYRSGSSWDIYARRVDGAGAPHWTGCGVALCTDVNSQQFPTIVSDGAEGAIVAWTDLRNGNWDIYSQRVNGAGAPTWTACGVALCTDLSSQERPTIAVSDGAGGAIVAWEDIRSSYWDIYTQRVSAAGMPQWTADGVALCTDVNSHQYPTIVSDGAEGAIVAWTDTRNGNGDIYAQRVYGSGGVAAVAPQGAAAHFQLLAPSPNPTRDGQLRIRFNLSSSHRVSAHVLDLAGHRVRTLATEREFSPGTQALGWDGKNDAGVGLPSGVYFVEVRVGAHSGARRAVLLH